MVEISEGEIVATIVTVTVGDLSASSREEAISNLAKRNSGS